MGTSKLLFALPVGLLGLGGALAFGIASTNPSGEGKQGGIVVVPKSQPLGDAAAIAPVPSIVKRATITTTFSPSDVEIPNPERGFYRVAWTDLADLKKDDVQDAFASGYRLVYAQINLEKFRTADISAAHLKKLETALGNARAGGVKMIIRAVYNDPANETEYKNAKDASLAQVTKHLTQLKSIIDQNSDVIAFVQAGFIGAWGEWHTSSNKLDTPANRTKVKDALLSTVPATRFVQFRYPPHLQGWSPVLPSFDRAFAEGFRLGFHNDCFLASSTDVGTYDEDPTIRQAQRDYAAKLTELAPFGGETCNPADEEGAVPRTECKDIRAEGALFHLTYLNDEYYRPLFHDRWNKGKCLEEVRRKMGYRFGLVQVAHDDRVARNGHLSVALAVDNAGWARLYNPRNLQLVLRVRGTDKLWRIPTSGTDPRRWLPGVRTDATLDAALPQDVPAGTYDVLIALPDRDIADARYAIRFANLDVPAQGKAWDAKIGAFSTGTTLQVE